VSTDRLLSVEEARRAVFAAIAGPTPAEIAWLMEARGRVVAEPVTSPIDLPPWDNSAMDGYAVRAADVAAATDDAPARLEVIGEVRAGHAPEVTVRRGSAVRIATGAPVPPGADAVVPVEQTTPVATDGEAAGPRGRDATGPLPAGILVHAAVPTGGSIRPKGSDLAAGTRILDAGMVLTPAAIGLAAGVGLDQLAVHRRPIVGILTTGDEVRAPGRDLGPAGIPDANGPGLVAMVESAGGDPRVLGIAKDDLDDVKSRICAGLVEGADALIVSGGVSVGPYDVVRAGFEAYGTVDLWRVAVQPGKPFAFGTGRASRDDGSDGGSGDSTDVERPAALLFGLPGNPVSTFVTFELFVRPAIRRLAGHRDDDLFRAVDRAVLDGPVTKGHGRRAFVRVSVERDEHGTPRRDDHGRVLASLAGGQGGQGSHVLSALATADALAVINESDDSLPAGAEVELWWLDRA
jgi:molybdopterin molybdotransferase